MITAYVQQSGAARWVLQVTVLSFVVGEAVMTLRRRRGAHRVSIPAEMVLRAVLVGAVVWVAAARALAPAAVITGGAVVFVVGALCAWLGLLLRWWSALTLGPLFTTVLTVESDQPVIESGPYRWLRHPSYLGLLLAFAGCGVMVGNWLGLLGSVILVLAALVFRIRVEEHALAAALGERYLAFAGHRARLVPFVW